MKSLLEKLSILKRLKLDLSKYIEEHYFRFDSSFEENKSNYNIYCESLKPIVDFAMSGGKISCFAYGQTGKFTRKW